MKIGSILYLCRCYYLLILNQSHNNERMTRSRGQAPEIENVLKAPIECSKDQQKKFKD